MTVSELIEELNRYDKHMPVLIGSSLLCEVEKDALSTDTVDVPVLFLKTAIEVQWHESD
ncbi:hypothetical protein [Listeria marthii]|uniref:hypothetical protein n=1 Tax=Listeria marthii TaxID=529731 RepID=UPI00162A2468|nr:hypothetical protein [Listeria marthii]MBC2037912.1 hypothetical protein [Listeria marthii]